MKGRGPRLSPEEKVDWGARDHMPELLLLPGVMSALALLDSRESPSPFLRVSDLSPALLWAWIDLDCNLETGICFTSEHTLRRTTTPNHLFAQNARFSAVFLFCFLFCFCFFLSFSSYRTDMC